MGWSWAPWLAHRAHTHQLRLGLQSIPHRILEGTNPPGPIDPEEVLIVPYIDNLTVLGLSAPV
eukprot:1611543-Amphidinium_carterae.1